MIADNGIGFDPAAVAARPPDPTRGGMGLRSMRERAQGAGIHLEVKSALSRGATVSAVTPLR